MLTHWNRIFIFWGIQNSELKGFLLQDFFSLIFFSTVQRWGVQSHNGGSALIPLPSFALEPEKELKELAGSHLGQTVGQLLLPASQPPASSQLCLIMMLSNQPSCRVTILFWCGKMKQDSGLSRRPGHCTWITKQKCVSFFLRLPAVTQKADA